jgi:hypothetical protein
MILFIFLSSAILLGLSKHATSMLMWILNTCKSTEYAFKGFISYRVTICLFIITLKNNGVVEIEKNDTFSFQFEISDYFENISLLEFEVYYLDVDLMKYSNR